MNSVDASTARNARRIMIVDDDARLTRIIALQLRLSGEWELVGSAPDPGAALRLAEAEHPHVVLLDLWLHGVDSMGLLADLLALSPPPMVVMLTAEPHPDWRERALAAGASAYLSKLEMLDIPAALREV